MDWLPPAVYIAFYYAALVWVAVLIGLFTWATISFIRQRWPVLWPLRVLSAMGTTSATLLYIPLFYLLVSGFACHDKKEVPHWQALGYTCYSGGHIAQTIIAVLLTLAFVALCSLFTLTYFDSNPLSPNLAAKAHGRTDAVVLAMKTLLVVLVEVYPHSIGHLPLTIIVAASAVVWLGLHIATLPFIHHSMNRLVAALAAVYLWVAVALIFAEALPDFDAAILLYAGSIPSAIAGSALADARADRIHRTPVARLNTAMEIELKVRGPPWPSPRLHACRCATCASSRSLAQARFMLHEGLHGHPTSRVERRAALEDGGATAQSQAIALDDIDGSDEAEARIMQARARIPASTVQEVEAVFKHGLSRFRNSALLHVFAARFYSVYCGNVHLQMK